LTGKEHALIEAGIVNGLADSAKRLKPLLAALALVEEVLDRSFDELIHIPVLAGGQFILDGDSRSQGIGSRSWPFLVL